MCPTPIRQGWWIRPIPWTNDYRAVALVNNQGQFNFTETRAYSGNNGRAAIFNNTNGSSIFYTAGNAGNVANPQPDGIIIGAGAQLHHSCVQSEDLATARNAHAVVPLQRDAVGRSEDKIGKDDNSRPDDFQRRGLLHQGQRQQRSELGFRVDPTLTICTDSNGVGLPPANASLPTAPLDYNPGVAADRRT